MPQEEGLVLEEKDSFASGKKNINNTKLWKSCLFPL
jgi:hypothetical protein